MMSFGNGRRHHGPLRQPRRAVAGAALVLAFNALLVLQTFDVPLFAFFGY